MASDLERAYEALKGKQARYKTYWDYYDGDHPLVYAAERLKEVFKDRFARFSQNQCAVVIDSEKDRVTLQQFDVANDEAASKRLNELFETTELKLDADDVHEAALVTGEAFVIVWKDAEGEVEAYFNEPRLCHVFYDEENPRQKSFAAKWWNGKDEKRYLNLYYRDRIEYYVSRGKAQNVTSANAFVTAQPNAQNPFGAIPVFHFRTERRKIKSELVNVVELQDAINKLLADMMVAAEFGAFRQRWVISNSAIKDLKNAPNEIWDVPAGDGQGQQTAVGEFGETDLGNYLEAIDKLAASIAVITRTPKHYLFGQAGTPSGEALIAMEAPLNKKAQRHIDRFAVTWRRVAAFMLLLSGEEGVGERDITAQFEKPETVQPRTQAEIREINGRSGIPLRTSLRWEGKTEKEIETVAQEKREEGEAQQLSFAAMLASAERRRDQEEAA